MQTGLHHEPGELSELRELVAALQGTLSTVQTENQLLRQKLEFFLKRYFGGTRTESLDPKQLELLLAGFEALSAPAALTEEAKPASTRSTSVTRPVRQALPAHLETERVVLEPDEVQQQPDGWRRLGEEVTEELDWKPAQFIKRLYIRPKYANADRIVIAPLPARLIEKGLPGAGLLTQLIVSKYEDHLPLYRQEKIYRERHGVNLTRQTMNGWVEAAAGWLGPIYREMKATLLEGNYLQADETPIRYLDPDVKGKSRPILARLRRALEIVRRRVLPKSLLGQAIDYTLARWAALTRYVEDGRLEIDNNQCENAIRPTAVGKKNFLFVGHPEAGQRSAIIYSILGSCRRHGVNPAEYLRDLFERLPKAKTSEIKSLTPAAWAKTRRPRPSSAT